MARRTDGLEISKLVGAAPGVIVDVVDFRGGADASRVVQTAAVAVALQNFKTGSLPLGT